jgi:tetratricopeptide (TPR) repeat protein
MTGRIAGTLVAIAVVLHAPPTHAQQSPSDTLQRADELYQGEDYYGASVELAKVVDKETNDSEEGRQRAVFALGKTLFQLDYHAASLGYFFRIVEAGESHPYFKPTLVWLAALSRELPDSSGILEMIGRYEPSDVDDPALGEARDEVAYSLAYHFYTVAEFDKAVELVRRVDDKSPLYLKATFLDGVIHVRRYDSRPAVEAFERLLEIAETRPDDFDAADVERFAELANLQLARIFYSTQQFARALDYYSRLSTDSIGYADSLFEEAWALHAQGKHSRSLAKLQELYAPSVGPTLVPEARIFEAYIYFERCLYNTALRTVAAFDLEHAPLKKAMKGILEGHDDNVEFFQYAKKLEELANPDEAERLLVEHLRAPRAQDANAWVEQVGREQVRWAASPEQWRNTTFGSELQEVLLLERSLAEHEAGKVLRDLFDRTYRELREYSRDSIKVRIESIDAKERFGEDPDAAEGARRGAGEPVDTDPTGRRSGTFGYMSFQPTNPDEADPDDEFEIDFDDEPEFDEEEDLEPELDPDFEEDLEPKKYEPMPPTDPRLKEDAWEWAPAPAGEGDPPVVIGGEHAMWKLNGGYATSTQGDYRFRLRWICKEEEPSYSTDAASDIDGEEVGELISPDEMWSARHYVHYNSLVRIRSDFVLQVLRSAEQLRASGVL